MCGATLASCGVQRSTTAQQDSGNDVFECIGLTDKGECIVTATGNGRNPSLISQTTKKNAVYALLFDGIKGNSENRIKDLPPLIADKNVLNTRAEYFSSFFSSDGSCPLFVKSMPGTLPKTVKTKTGYKVTETILLDRNALRKELERNGIIKSL